MRKLWLSTMALAGALSLSTVARATPDVDRKNDLSAQDRDFIQKAATGGLAEVKMGQLAVEKASDPTVKQFGQRMVTDHSRANDDLKQIAMRKSIQLPTELTGEQRARYDDLSKMSGPAFDRAYMDAMVKDHDTDSSEFAKEDRAGKDPDVKTFARDTLRIIRMHDHMAHRDTHRM